MGQVLLLLQTICTRLNYSLQEYNILSRGSYSEIEVKDKVTQSFRHRYKLYATNDTEIVSTGVTLSSSVGELNNGLGALIGAFMEIVNHVKGMDAAFTLPFAVTEDRVDGLSIKVGLFEIMLVCK